MNRPINPENSDRNDRDRSDNRRRTPSSPYRGNRNNNTHRRDFSKEKYSKSMIFLKSTVLALFIVLLVLVAGFFIVKNNQTLSAKLGINQKCKNSAIKVGAEIDEISSSKRSVVLLTKRDSSGKQELIRLDGKCLDQVLRISIEK